MSNSSACQRQIGMSRFGFSAVSAALCASAVLAPPASAEKVLMYDEEKGIVFVDKDAPPANANAGRGAQPRQEAAERPAVRKAPAAPRTADTSFIRGKKKDPSEAYFESGLQYFKAGDYNEALRLFVFADSTDPRPTYALWVGKTYRQLGKTGRQLFIMKKILDTYPESDVADDALFEIAFAYQVADDYDSATRLYTRLAEQYPFGSSYSNGESFRDIVKQQKQMMRSEIVTTLRLLGYNGTELEDLVASFQNAKGIQATGRCDQKTVRAVKADYRDFQKNEDKAVASRQRKEALLKWTGVLGCINLLVIAVLAGVRVSTAAKKRQVAGLEQTLADLDGRQI